MASENVELVRHLIDAFAAGERDELLALLHPDVVISEWPDAPDTKSLRGQGSEVEVDVAAFSVYEVRDGKVARMEFFTSKEPALRAAGIDESEDAA